MYLESAGILGFSAGNARFLEMQHDGTSTDFRVGTGSGAAKITSRSANDLILHTNDGTSSGEITITDGVNGNITVNPDGTGRVGLGNYIIAVDQTLSASEDGYVMTYSNSSGEISLREAGGGGGSSYPPTLATSIDSAYDMYMLTSLPPFTRTVLSSTTQSIGDSPYLVPFLAPVDITGVALEISITGSGAGSNLLLCLYESSATTGTPTSKVTNSDLTIDGSTTGYKTGTFSSSVSLSSNTAYWIAMCSDNLNITVRTHPSDAAPPVGLINGMDNFNKGLLQDTVSSGSLPASMTAGDLETLYGLPPMVGMQV
tara:strand:- start:403 stop:1344 length:942 start_codon:yes stop_codon:yes gene_type:complete